MKFPVGTKKNLVSCVFLLLVSKVRASNPMMTPKLPSVTAGFFWFFMVIFVGMNGMNQIHIYVNIFMYICMYFCMYVNIFIYIYKYHGKYMCVFCLEFWYDDDMLMAHV